MVPERTLAELASPSLQLATATILCAALLTTVPATARGVHQGFGVFRFDDPDFGPGFAKSGRVTGSACQFLHFDRAATTVVACKNSFDAFLGGTVPNRHCAEQLGTGR